VPLEVVGDTVIFVAARLGDHIDHAAGSAPELRVIAAGPYLELLHRIHRRIDDAAINVGRGVRSAVEQDLLRARASAADMKTFSAREANKLLDRTENGSGNTTTTGFETDRSSTRFGTLRTTL
jgi:hypothetical protein